MCGIQSVIHIRTHTHNEHRHTYKTHVYMTLLNIIRIAFIFRPRYFRRFEEEQTREKKIDYEKKEEEEKNAKIKCISFIRFFLARLGVRRTQNYIN